jgi:hypothetical protein
MRAISWAKSQQRVICNAGLSHLWNYFEPCVYRNRPNIFGDHRSHLFVCSKFEPESQKTKGILNRIIASQSDRAEEAYLNIRSRSTGRPNTTNQQ